MMIHGKPSGMKKVKLTRSQLKHIIQEELYFVLNEQMGIEKHPDFIAAKKQRAIEKATVSYVLRQFFRETVKGAHEGMQGKWIEAISRGKEDFKKGKYLKALRNVVLAAAEEKLTGVAVLANAYRAISKSDITKSIAAAPRMPYWKTGGH